MLVSPLDCKVKIAQVALSIDQLLGSACSDESHGNPGWTLCHHPIFLANNEKDVTGGGGAPGPLPADWQLTHALNLFFLGVKELGLLQNYVMFWLTTFGLESENILCCVPQMWVS